MNTGSIIGGTALFGAIAASWGKLKVLFNYIRSLIIVTHKIGFPTRSSYLHFISSLNLKVPKLGTRTIRYAYLQGKDGSHIDVVGEKRIPMGSSCVVFINKKIPVWATFYPDESMIRLTYPRFLFNVRKIVIDAVKSYNDLNARPKTSSYGRWFISHKWGSLNVPKNGGKEKAEESSTLPETIEEETSATYFSSYDFYHHGILSLLYSEDPSNVGFVDHERMFKNSNKRRFRYITEEERKLKDSIEFWHRHRDWYKERRIPWKRGAILYGSPGTGKSSMVWEISRELDIPVQVFHLESFTNEDMFRKWNSSSQSNGCINLVEDIDSIFHKRENINRGNALNTSQPLTFDAFLNSIDGVERTEGIFLIITTNNPEHIDCALAEFDEDSNFVSISRPGRIDHVLECKSLDLKGATFIVDNILSDVPAEERRRFISELELPNTAAQIQEKCITAALNYKWNNDDKDIDD